MEDNKWEETYSQNRHMGHYPSEEVIRFIAKFYYSKDRSSIKILEIGCGNGKEIWYLAREGFDVYGIDGSKTAIEHCNDKLKKDKLKAELYVGDITKLPYQSEFFDVVIDHVSIQHNTSQDIKKILNEVYRVLKNKGRFFSVMRSNIDSFNKKGREIEKNTYTDIIGGGLDGVGKIHFFNEEEIKSLFLEFSNINIETSERTIENRTKKIAHWFITAEK